MANEPDLLPIDIIKLGHRIMQLLEDHGGAPLASEDILAAVAAEGLKLTRDPTYVRCCPFCSDVAISPNESRWNAVPQERHIGSPRQLSQHQCRSCERSFWT